MKNQEILQMADALREIDGLKVGCNATYAIAKNIRRIGRVVADIESARVKIANAITVGEDGKPDAASAEKADAEFRAFLAQDNSDFEPHQIRVTELNLWDGQGDQAGKNTIRASTFAALEPMIVDVPA